MGYYYLNTEDETDPWRLPNLEVFHANRGDWVTDDDEPCDPGYYYRFCFPGCLPDSEPTGPFDTEDAALTEARETHCDV